jgi:hypothetical protein
MLTDRAGRMRIPSDYPMERLDGQKLQPGIYLVRPITREGDIAGKLVVLR